MAVVRDMVGPLRRAGVMCQVVHLMPRPVSADAVHQVEEEVVGDVSPQAVKGVLRRSLLVSGHCVDSPQVVATAPPSH